MNVPFAPGATDASVCTAGRVVNGQLTERPAHASLSPFTPRRASWPSVPLFHTWAPVFLNTIDSGPLSISFRNAGSQSWIRGTLGQEARLAVNQDNAQWAALGVNWLSANRVASQTEATVVPGGVGTFTFQVRAPMTPGLYAIHLRPVIDGVTWMEDEGVFLYVSVVN